MFLKEKKTNTFTFWTTVDTVWKVIATKNKIIAARRYTWGEYFNLIMRQHKKSFFVFYYFSFFVIVAVVLWINIGRLGAQYFRIFLFFFTFYLHRFGSIFSLIKSKSFLVTCNNSWIYFQCFNDIQIMNTLFNTQTHTFRSKTEQCSTE